VVTDGFVGKDVNRYFPGEDMKKLITLTLVVATLALSNKVAECFAQGPSAVEIFVAGLGQPELGSAEKPETEVSLLKSAANDGLAVVEQFAVERKGNWRSTYTVVFKCPHCGERLTSPEGLLSDKRECSECSEAFRVSEQAGAEIKSLRSQEWMALGELVMYLMLAGLLGFYLRYLYNQCSRSVSDTDATARVFPLLIIVTAAVMAVVQNSIALSLGLIGALSIVRFRAAIKEPEELVYLFLCIASGLCLGSQQPWLAMVLVCVASVFAVLMRFLTAEKASGRLLLTLTGASDQFQDMDGSLLPKLEAATGNVSVQRFDLQEDHGQLRVVLGKANASQQRSLLSTLQKELPGYQVSLVNLDVL